MRRLISAWLGAFVDGSRHLETSTESAPGDIAWAYLDRLGTAVATGRKGRPFLARERHELTMLARILCRALRTGYAEAPE